MSFEMGWIFFQFNSIQFAVWYWGISTFVFDEFWKRLSFLSYSFKQDVTWQTSFLFTTDIIIPTNHHFQQWLYCRLPSFNTFHLPTIWAVIHFHFWSHHRHFKEPSFTFFFFSTNNNDYIVDFLLSTTFHLPTIWAVIHFHHWSHHRLFKVLSFTFFFFLSNNNDSIVDFPL